MSAVRTWLVGIGLGQYADAFEANDIEMDLLKEVDDHMLKDIGMTSAGHRIRIRNAITKLSPPSDVEPNANSAVAALEMAAASAERRQLTVMFCDLVGSTALSGRLDPEDLRGIINTYHRCCAEMVERNGGFVAKYMGDAVLAYFGYPRAHEYDAERAVQAGLGLVEAVPKLTTAAGVPLQARVGIATGLVVVGDLLGAGAAQEQAVVGETPNLAARLQALAEPGAVVISSSTRRLTAGLFDYRDLGVVALKGFTENVPIWQVLRASSAESRFEALRGSTTPLVGRGEETDLLLRRWQQAKGGDGCVVLVSGEPGIGKSRLAETLLERLNAEPHTRLRYFCSPHHQDSALYPTITQLERAASFRRDDTVEQRLDKLEAVLIQGTNNLGHDALLLAELLTIPTGDRYPSLDLSPQKRKERTLNALVAQVEGLAARQPVLMVVEDAHWVDSTSLELLDLMVERVPGMPILLIITFRPEFTARWVGRSHVTLLSLNRLPPRQRAEMIERVTGGKALPREIADQIIERTDGIPLFVEELTKAVVESGVLTDAGDRYTLTGSLPPQAIPTTLHASLLARLDRLASVREVAQVGAALGRQFSHELISAVATMPQQQLDDGLVQLVSAELIYLRGTPPDAEYTFKHALVQDAAYGTMLRSRRLQLHGRITATLEGQFPEVVETQPEVLARHSAEAGMIEKAVGYWLKAGQQAIARCAMTEAVAQLRKGLDLLSGLPDGAVRQEQELNLQIVLGHAQMAAKGLGALEPGEAFTRARQLCEQLNQPQQLGQVLIGQWQYHMAQLHLEQTEHHAAEMRDLGEARSDAMWTCFGSIFGGNTCCWLGKFADARAYLESAVSLWEPRFRAFAPTPDDPYVQALINLSRTLAFLGYFDQARSRRDEALAEARRLSPYNVVFALGLASEVNRAIEESAETMLRSADEVLAISSEQGYPLWFAVGKLMRGLCLAAAGQTAEGLPLLLQGFADYRATGSNAFPSGLTLLAEVYGMAAQPEKGLDPLDEAAILVETTQDRWAEAEMHRVRGTLLLAMHDHAAAEDNYRRALAVARRQCAKTWELRATLNLARLWNEQGKRTEARDLLGPVYGWFTEGFDTPVLQDAKALLLKLSGSPAVSTTGNPAAARRGPANG